MAKAVLNEKVSSMYNMYSSAIYGAREQINNRLAYLMQKDSIRYLHSVGNEAFQQVRRVRAKLHIYLFRFHVQSW